MSFWTDVRDTVTAPFRAVGGLAGDIVSGQNVLGTIGSRGGQFVAGTFGQLQAVGASAVKNFAPALADKPLIKEFTDVGSFSQSLAKDARVTTDEFQKFARGSLTLGAVAGGGIAASSLIGAGAAAGGALSAYQLSKGNVSDAFTTGFSTFAPQSFQNTVGDAKDALQPFFAPRPVSDNPIVPNYDFGENYFPVGGPLQASIGGSGKPSLLLPLLLVGAVGTLIYLRRKK